MSEIEALHQIRHSFSDLVAYRADDLDRLSCRVGEFPVLVALAGKQGLYGVIIDITIVVWMLVTR